MGLGAEGGDPKRMPQSTQSWWDKPSAGNSRLLSRSQGLQGESHPFFQVAQHISSHSEPWLFWALNGCLGSQIPTGAQTPRLQLSSRSSRPFHGMHAKLLQPCPTVSDPMDHSPPGSSVHGILQARILEWVAMPSSRVSSWPRDQAWISYISCIGRGVLYH